MTEYDDFISISNNIYTKEFCKDVCDFYDKCIKQNLVIKGDNFTIPKSARDDTCINIPSSLPSDCFPSTWIQYYSELLCPLVIDYKKKYSFQQELFSFNFKVHKVIKGQGYHAFHHEHCSNSSGIAYGGHSGERVLAFMTYVKCPSKGGETEFLFQSKRVEPRLGLTMIWPAYFTHLHRGNPVLEGEKIYITGWWSVK